jgi:type IV pilus assembly protein PilW
VLEGDLVHAGFWGTHVPQYDDLTYKGVPADVPDVVPPPCLTFDASEWSNQFKSNLVGVTVQPYGSVPVDCGGTGKPVANAQAESDVLVVRHADTCVPGEGSCPSDVSGDIYFQPSRCKTDTIPYRLDTSGFTLRANDCSSSTEKRKLVSNVYYVRSFAATASDGIPTLVRSRFQLVGGNLTNQSPEALVEGIESVRIELGIDSFSETGAAVDNAAARAWQDPETKAIATNRGDGVPDGAWVRCDAGCSVAQLTNAVVARVYVLARAREKTPGFRDLKTYRLGSAPTLCSTASTDAGCDTNTLDPGYKRAVFSSTVRLVNVASRRETP